jgi:hypothetical protein
MGACEKGLGYDRPDPLRNIYPKKNKGKILRSLLEEATVTAGGSYGHCWRKSGFSQMNQPMNKGKIKSKAF